MPARIHASDNLRQTSRLNPGNAPYGMPLGMQDALSLTYNVTNDSDMDKVVYVQMVGVSPFEIASGF
jgi:hypothetical protein